VLGRRLKIKSELKSGKEWSESVINTMIINILKPLIINNIILKHQIRDGRVVVKQAEASRAHKGQVSIRYLKIDRGRRVSTEQHIRIEACRSSKEGDEEHVNEAGSGRRNILLGYILNVQVRQGCRRDNRQLDANRKKHDGYDA
jgi:hypothetical protein